MGGPPLLKGNDFLTYEFGNTSCAGLPSGQYCLNVTWWNNLVGLAAEGNLSMVFGLNIMKRVDNRWDPTNTRELLTYAIERNQTLFGLELGNEQNTKLSTQQAAADFATLHRLLQELYPNAANRPRIVGPDIHSFKGWRLILW